MMPYWAKTPMDRHQVVSFPPTLDERIEADHPLRLFWEVVKG